MTLKKLSINDTFTVFIIFFVLHLVLLNINVAEWGDSYRILRASEYMRTFDYPTDEKRAPLFSLILAIRPEFIDQVLWGRAIMLVISAVSFFVFRQLLIQYKFNVKQQKLALILFTLNPVYLYWSIRIMADVPFTLLVMLAFMLLNSYRLSSKPIYLLLAGFITGLSVLTRFEGYILGFTLGLDLLFKKQDIKSKIKELFVFGISSIFIMLPWFLYRNPLTSSYFEEPSGRAYDLTTIWIYLASLLFLFGVTQAFYFLLSAKSSFLAFLQKNTGFAVFLVLELILALVWPAAIPRLFTPVIPFLIILLVPLVFEYFKNAKPTTTSLIINILLLGFFVISQYYLKLQFLILIKLALVVLLVIQLIIIYSIYVRNYKIFFVSSVFSMLVWSLATIYIHKDIFRVVQEANLYISQNLQGSVAYNDVSSVSDWHLNQKNKNDTVAGFYLNMDSKKGRSLSTLQEKEPDYLLITNEHNPTLEFDASEVTYLEPLTEFRYTIRGTEFFTKIVKVKYDNK